MSLNGTGLRFIEATTIPQGSPGGTVRLTIAAVVAASSYPALGEPIATLLTALWALPESRAHVAPGVKPSNVVVTENLGHFWTYDPAQGTMGSLRNWTAIGNTPTEHVTGAYAGNEVGAILRITMEFPLSGSMSR